MSLYIDVNNKEKDIQYLNTDTSAISAASVESQNNKAKIKIELREANCSADLISELAAGLGISAVTAGVLAKRGVLDIESGERFLAPTLNKHLPDPKLLKNGVEAVRFIIHAIKANKRIWIYTDYDVDGLTSGAQLKLILSRLGANVSTFTPNRFDDGYGLQGRCIDKINNRGADLIIALDCGITSIKEIEFARSLGLQTVIIDHHLPTKGESNEEILPDADFVIDPYQQGCGFLEHKLCTAGLVWIVSILFRKVIQEEFPEFLDKIIDPKDLLDLACVGTVCDMVPLVGLNRLIVMRGLEALAKTERIGLKALLKSAGYDSAKKIGVSAISFGIGPRINAAGRMSEGGQVIDLLITDDSSEAQKSSKRISKLNDERKGVEEQVKNTCFLKIKEEDPQAQKAGYLIFDQSFHLGVIGIAAQRIVEKYYRPAAVCAPSTIKVGREEVVVAKGSVRGISGFHVAEALADLGGLLLNHGGHAEAGGFTVEYSKLSEFKDAFEEIAKKKLGEDQFVKVKRADCEVSILDITHDLITEISRLGPFGIGNPAPQFILKDVKVQSAVSFSGEHLKLKLGTQDGVVSAIYWKGRSNKRARKDEVVTILFTPEIKSYQGLSFVELNIKELQ